MKKLLALLILTTFLGCGSLDLYNYETVKGWGYEDLPPSQVRAYKIKLSNKSYSIGELIPASGDGEYYYNSLYQDLGWYEKDDKTWVNNNVGAHRPLSGRLYFSIKRGVAVYISNKYSVYRLILNTPTEKELN